MEVVVDQLMPMMSPLSLRIDHADPVEEEEVVDAEEDEEGEEGEAEVVAIIARVVVEEKVVVVK